MSSFTLAKYLELSARPVPKTEVVRPGAQSARVRALCQRLHEDLLSKIPTPNHKHQVHRARQIRVYQWLRKNLRVIPLWGPVQFEALQPIFGWRIVARATDVSAPVGTGFLWHDLRNSWQIITAREDIRDGVVLYRADLEIGRLS